jgi:hypothetical protein
MRHVLYERVTLHECEDKQQDFNVSFILELNTEITSLGKGNKSPSH